MGRSVRAMPVGHRFAVLNGFFLEMKPPPLAFANGTFRALVACSLDHVSSVTPGAAASSSPRHPGAGTGAPDTARDPGGRPASGTADRTSRRSTSRIFGCRPSDQCTLSRRGVRRAFRRPDAWTGVPARAGGLDKLLSRAPVAQLDRASDSGSEGWGVGIPANTFVQISGVISRCGDANASTPMESEHRLRAQGIR